MRLEVVEVGFDFGADADGVAERREDRDDFIHRARNGMLGSGEAARAGQRDVDGFGGKSGIAGARAGGVIDEALDEFLQRLEALADGFLCCGRSGLEPACRDVVEAALLAAYPAEAEGFEMRRCRRWRRLRR